MSFKATVTALTKGAVEYTEAVAPTGLIEVTVNSEALAAVHMAPRSAVAKTLRWLADNIERADWPPVQEV